MRISELRISNYKSFAPDSSDIKLSNITSIIGANSAGKTNLLEALDLFFHPTKLGAISFHKEQFNIPICISVVFDQPKPADCFEMKSLQHQGKITLKRVFNWDSNKLLADFNKDLAPGGIWEYSGNISMLNPFPKEKPKANNVQSFLNTTDAAILNEFATFKGTTINSTNYIATVREYWSQFDIESTIWNNNFRWTTTVSAEITGDKSIKEIISNLDLPEFIYLPVEHSINDEMSLKKGSRLDRLFGILLKLTEEDQNKQKKELDILQKRVDAYYSKYFDKKLDTINKQLKSPKKMWDFSQSQLEIKRSHEDLESILQPSWHLTSNDGFLSEIEAKGKGMQRLAVFQMLQTYSDLRFKNANSTVILAIEEPELYLHPPFKRALYQLFRDLTDSFQVLYTTHDPIFVQLEYFDEIRLIHKNSNYESLSTSVEWNIFENNSLWKNLFGRKKTNEAKRQELFNKCHGEQNEGFFSEKIILVEGNTELYALPIYLKKMGFDIDKKSISLIQAQGVDALLAMYAIYVAFGIPVYIIFDGDKPTPENYTKYQLINKIGKEKYFSFLNELNNCVCEKGSITAIQNKIKNVAPLLPLDLINELEKTEPNFEQIKLLLNSDYLLSKDKYNSIKNKENRNQKIQQYLGSNISMCFPDTHICSNYAVWEYYFEKNISMGVKNYTQLYNEATRECDGKPLIAKLIARRAKKEDFTPELNTLLSSLTEAILSAKAIPLSAFDTTCKIAKKPEYYIQLLDYKEENSYKVFSCAAGPLNPEADDPIAFANGVLPTGTQFIIKVVGSSMHPTIPAESYLAIRKNGVELKNNMIGIFCFDGNSICKQYTINKKDGTKRLISLNKKVKPIEISESSECIFWGEVICGKDKKPYLLDVQI